jgi:hypothetical protein
MEVSMTNKAKAERLYFALPEAIRRQDRHGIYKALAAELDRINSEERPPMTDSALVQEVRQAIRRLTGPGSELEECLVADLIISTRRLCDEFDAAIKRGLAAAETVQVLTKKLEKYENGL